MINRQIQPKYHKKGALLIKCSFFMTNYLALSLITYLRIFMLYAK